jgi:hypothetical protein
MPGKEIARPANQLLDALNDSNSHFNEWREGFSKNQKPSCWNKMPKF